MTRNEGAIEFVRVEIIRHGFQSSVGHVLNDLHSDLENYDRTRLAPGASYDFLDHYLDQLLEASDDPQYAEDVVMEVASFLDPSYHCEVPR